MRPRSRKKYDSRRTSAERGDARGEGIVLTERYLAGDAIVNRAVIVGVGER